MLALPFLGLGRSGRASDAVKERALSVPNVRVTGDRAHHLAELVGRLGSLGREHARLCGESKALNDLWHESQCQGCVDGNSRQTCNEPDCDARWLAYVERDNEADEVKDDRERTYRQIRQVVRSILDDHGFGTPFDLATYLEATARVMATVQAGGHTFMVVGNVDFDEWEINYDGGWYYSEVIIL
jgi:hypothetical protein